MKICNEEVEETEEHVWELSFTPIVVLVGILIIWICGSLVAEKPIGLWSLMCGAITLGVFAVVYMSVIAHLQEIEYRLNALAVTRETMNNRSTDDYLDPFWDRDDRIH